MSRRAWKWLLVIGSVSALAILAAANRAEIERRALRAIHGDPELSVRRAETVAECESLRNRIRAARLEDDSLSEYWFFRPGIMSPAPSRRISREQHKFLREPLDEREPILAARADATSEELAKLIDYLPPVGRPSGPPTVHHRRNATRDRPRRAKSRET